MNGSQIERLPVNPFDCRGHEVAYVCHEDKKERNPDQGVDDAEHLALVSFWYNMAIAWFLTNHIKKLFYLYLAFFVQHWQETSTF